MTRSPLAPSGTRRQVLASATGLMVIGAVGLPLGEHSVPIELADPAHRVINGRVVSLQVPTHPSTHQR
jgi:hypothetical protein